MLSKAYDCADLVLSFKALNLNRYFRRDYGSVYDSIRIGDRTGVGTTLSKMTSGAYGASLEIIRRLLGHTQIGTNQRYPHLIDSPLRAKVVIPPFLTRCSRRIHAAIFSFWAGVMPPMPMFGRSLL